MSIVIIIIIYIGILGTGSKEFKTCVTENCGRFKLGLVVTQWSKVDHSSFIFSALCTPLYINFDYGKFHTSPFA